jgi:hypothetical protein
LFSLVEMKYPCRYYVGGFRVESVSGQLWNAVKDTFSKSITLLRDRWNLFNENVSLVKLIWIVLSWTHLFECRFTMYFILTFEVSSKKNHTNVLFCCIYKLNFVYQMCFDYLCECGQTCGHGSSLACSPTFGASWEERRRK